MTATISRVQLTATHDGEAAVAIELTFPNGGRSQVHINADEAVDVLALAGVASVDALVGHPWTVLDVRDPKFMG
ncbi:hypothetical protein SAMN06295912_11633 [Sphingomonas laterariae]|uniref:Uncharacterized protein n=1 Tax=Edaphosphingomonas laterariae TaxID=861865 RepID=A0A239HCM4_9SPHN|nr:hypothetical protein [Sphingomonas laterariae]SNS78778.1 hypothetical protein SAMN06295912_11633 [Sphingomonas laterariae]